MGMEGEGVRAYDSSEPMAVRKKGLRRGESTMNTAIEKSFYAWVCTPF